MLSKREQLLFYAALAILGLWVLNLFVLTPITDVMNQTRQERDRLATEVATMYDLIDRRPMMRQRWQEMQDQGLTENPSVTEQMVFQHLQQWSDEYGVVLTTMTPSRNPVEVGMPSINFNVAGKGSLAGVCRLVYQLEETSLPVRMESLTLGSTNAAGESLTIQMKLNVPYLDLSIPLTEASMSF